MLLKKDQTVNLTSVAYIISHIKHAHATYTEHIKHDPSFYIGVIYHVLKGVSLLKTHREGNNS